MCSNMCARPVLPIGSCTEPASTCVKDEKTGASGRSQRMMVSPLASFFTVVRFSNEARSWPKASEHSTKQTTIVCIRVVRDFILPPRRNTKNSKLRGGREDCQTTGHNRLICHPDPERSRRGRTCFLRRTADSWRAIPRAVVHRDQLDLQRNREKTSATNVTDNLSRFQHTV